MKTRKQAIKEYNDVHYLFKCPYCGEELVVAYSELEKELFEPKEVEQELSSLSIIDGNVDISKPIQIYKGIKCCNCGHIWDEPIIGMYEKRCNPDGTLI